MLKRLLQVRAARGFGKEERGGVLIEFALSILLILVILFSTLELCSAVYTYTVLADAANEGLRYLIVHSSDDSGAKAKVRTYAALSLHDVSGTKLDVEVTPLDGTLTPPNRVSVSVTYQYVPYLSAFMASPPTMSAYAEGRLVY